jgi:GDP-L-fucose synthase
MARPRVLLTGGSGFIGGHIGLSKLADAYEILAPPRRELDLLDTAGVDAYFAAHKVEAVIHAAGKPGHRNAPDHDALLATNTRQYFNLARHAPELRRFIVIGSGAVYGADHFKPRMGEDFFGANIPTDAHGYTQYICCKHLEASPNTVYLAVFGIFGPREDYAIRFISNMMCKCLFDMPLTMKQDRRLDYLYIDDLMPVLDHFLGAASARGIYNVTPDSTSSLLDLARRVLAVSGKSLPILVGSEGMGREYSGDNALLKREFPAFRAGSMDAALRKLYAWYGEHRHLVRKEELVHDK